MEIYTHVHNTTTTNHNRDTKERIFFVRKKAPSIHLSFMQEGIGGAS